jgi:dihydroflavonol-4-reductase
MIMNDVPAYPNVGINCVDIKDVAKAHLRAMERPEAANKRFILSLEESTLFIEQANLL